MDTEETKNEIQEVTPEATPEVVAPSGVPMGENRRFGGARPERKKNPRKTSRKNRQKLSD